MKYKCLIILFSLISTSQLWSQVNQQIKLEEKLVSDISKTLLLKSTPAKTIFAAMECAFSIFRDTANSYYSIRSNIINKACNYIGVSYRYGQSSEKGFDCSGYVKFIFQNFGLALPHSSYAQYKISKRLDPNETQYGDLVFFITRGKVVSHVGIYLGNNQFIHSPGRGRTVSIDSLDAEYYKKHLVGFGSVL
jgi:cell wall-associated NlpC family hydrolase